MKPVFAALLLAAIVMACNSPEKKETVTDDRRLQNVIPKCKK